MSAKRTTSIEPHSDQQAEPSPPDSTPFSSPAGGKGSWKPETHFDPMMETIVKRGAQLLLQEELARKDSNGHDTADPLRVLFFKLAQVDGTRPQLEKLDHEIPRNNSNSLLRELKLRGAELLILEEMGRKDTKGRPAANPSRLLFLEIAWRNELRLLLKALQKENEEIGLLANELQEESERPLIAGDVQVERPAAGAGSPLEIAGDGDHRGSQSGVLPARSVALGVSVRSE